MTDIELKAMLWNATSDLEKERITAFRNTTFRDFVDKLERCDLYDVCMNYRHDYGLLGPIERENLRSQARQWLEAWKKAVASSQNKQG